MEGAATSSADVGDRRSIAWPFWMLRYVATDEMEALDDLLGSVEGSPYGAISYEEASAVFGLVNDFRGPGEASEERYCTVENLLIA